MKLLFVCTGNICRSPMAERLAVVLGDEVGLDVHAKSAGTLGLIDRPADPKAVKVCAEVGVDVSDHRSQGITDELVDWADWVVVMTYEHAAHVREHHPNVGEKVRLLGTLIGEQKIHDPIGAWTFTFRRVRKTIERGLRALLVDLAG